MKTVYIYQNFGNDTIRAFDSREKALVCWLSSLCQETDGGCYEEGWEDTFGKSFAHCIKDLHYNVNWSVEIREVVLE